MIHTMPLAMALRRARPDIDLTWVTQPESAPLLTGHPAVTRVELFPRHGSLPERLGALRRLRARRVELAIDPQGNLKSALVLRALRAERRLGLRWGDATERPNRLAHLECVAPCDPAAHVVDRYLSFAEHLGIRAPCVEFGLSPAAEEGAAAERWLADTALGPPTPVLVVQVGRLDDVRQWRADRLGAVADLLAQRHGHACLVVTGREHVADGRDVVRRIRRARCVDAAGILGLRALLALFAALAGRPGSLLLSGDTAPVHLAVAAGLRVVGIYGSQPPGRNGPYGGEADVVTREAELPCAPCRRRTCALDAEPRACMERVTVQEVLARIEAGLGRSAGDGPGMRPRSDC